MLNLKGLIAIISIGLSAFLAFWFNQPTDKVNVTELMEIGRGQIISTHYSPDKSTFVVASTLGLWLYDTADWTAEPRLLPSKGLLIGFSYTANGAYMVGFMDDRVQVWDASTGIEREFLTRNDQIIEAQLNVERTHLLISFVDQTLQIWDMDNLTLRHTKTIDFLYLLIMNIGSDEKWLQLLSRDYVNQIWNMETGELFDVQVGANIHYAFFVPDGTFFVMSSGNKLWKINPDTAESIPLDISSRVMSFKVSPDATKFLTVSDDGVQVWDMASLSLIATMDQLDYSYFHKPYFRADSLYLIDEGVPDVMWDVETGEILPLVADKTDMPHPAIDFKYDGDGLVLTILEGDDEGQVYRLGGYSRDVIDGAISPDGRFIGKLGKGYLELLDAQDGQSIWRTELPDERDLYRMEFSPNSERIIIFPREGVITVWDVATGARLADFEGDKRWDPYMTYHPDKALVALGTVDGEVWVWDIETGVALYRLTGGQSQRHAHFSSDGTMILSSGYFGTNDVLIWDVATGEKRSEFNFAFDASFSVDSQSLLGIVGERLMRWDLETGTLLPVVRDNAIDVDYKWFVIPDDAGTVEYRMAQVHHYIRGLMDRAGRRRIIHTTFSADFSRVVTFEVDGTIRIWEISE